MNDLSIYNFLDGNISKHIVNTEFNNEKEKILTPPNIIKDASSTNTKNFMNKNIKFTSRMHSMDKVDNIKIEKKMNTIPLKNYINNDKTTNKFKSPMTGHTSSKQKPYDGSKGNNQVF